VGLQDNTLADLLLTHDCYLSLSFSPAGAHPSGMLGEDPHGMAVNLPARLAQIAARGNNADANIQIFGSDYDTKDGSECFS